MTFKSLYKSIPSMSVAFRESYLHFIRLKGKQIIHYRENQKQRHMFLYHIYYILELR